MNKALDALCVFVIVMLAFAWFLVWLTIGMLWTLGWLP